MRSSRNQIWVVFWELARVNSGRVSDIPLREGGVLKSPKSQDTVLIGVEVEIPIGHSQQILIDRVPVWRGDGSIFSKVALELKEHFTRLFLARLLLLILFVLDLSLGEGSEAPDSFLLVIFNKIFLYFNFRVVSIQNVLFVVGIEVKDSVYVFELLRQLGVVQKQQLLVGRSVLQLLNHFLKGLHLLVLKHLSLLGQLLLHFWLLLVLSVKGRIFY